jgi:hypothetical protein
MITKCFIKSFLLIFVVFLIIKCWNNNETFTNIDLTDENISNKIKNYNPFELELDNKYVFVTFNQLNEKERKNVIDILKNNSNFMDIREIKQQVENGIFYKTPIFLVPKDKVISNNKLDFVLISESGDYVLSPRPNYQIQKEEFLYFNETLGLLYSCVDGPPKDIIRINQNGFFSTFGLNENWNNTNLMTIQKVDNKKLKFKISLK